MTDRASLTALRNMIAEAESLISTTAPLPENRTLRSLELLRAALALVDDMVTFVGVNGREFSATEAEVVTRILALADGSVTQEALADWIRRQQENSIF